MTPTHDEKLVAKKILQKRLFFSFLSLLIFFVFIGLFYNSTSEDTTANETSEIARLFFNANERLFSFFQSSSRLSVVKPKPPKGTAPRTNGSEGLESALELSNYKISVLSGLQRISLPLAAFHSLPATEVTTDFKCIEGWSEVIHYKGVRFSDFMTKYNLGKKSDGTYYKFVALETPDQKYYVSLDMKSMLHPQTVLAYEMNETSLSVANGAPLRLIIPIKYGIKSLKRIGRIFFSDEQPKDYWTEQGYDWFSGL